MQETREVMNYEYKEMKIMVSRKNVLGDATILNDLVPPFVTIFCNPISPSPIDVISEWPRNG